MFVSVLGLVPEMDKVVNLCEKYDVILLEDTCESMGSKYRDTKLGTFGKMASFSTFFGHHISTIEGGFISTDDKDLYDILLAIRAHGWDRGLKNKKKNFNFINSGFNLRQTDVCAAIGLNQFKRLNQFK